MNTTYLGLELRRILRDRASLFFIVALPAFLYVVFGATQDGSQASVGNGNVALYIMLSMAAYGAVTATVGIGGTAAVERLQGWGRQLGLTPLPDLGFVVVKAALAVLVSLLPVALISVVGALTGASGTASAWALSLLAIAVGSVVFALFGLCAGLAFRSEAAVSAASGMVVILAFLGNVFVPLSGTLLTIAKFTPLYGYATLARYPVTEGRLISNDGSDLGTDPLWVPLLNLGVWCGVLGVVAVLLVRRGRARP
ncbi:ABC transporter permease [Nocardioides zeae]|uniref:ABC-2 type transport system permease protein n=1 Tax=Nocardioides zeae TaxID=1457234 RepID=A0AAJ1U1C0_9ACTN|nr:ABC transporter permease [Nocardioides zeae]MDQ1106186.1 ABC-2 type transport system permease protein [Nocardioides zeae]